MNWGQPEAYTLFLFMGMMLFHSIIPACPFCAEGNEEQTSALPDLAELSLEELMNIEITSVSKKPEKLSNAAAAIFVITQEDIRRSGMTSIPEVLRMVPGLQVARLDSNKWAISSRGFNDRFANKLLVLIDGRSVYTPLFSGVNWEVKDIMLEDVERIEVIRGPGATLWGANAVNGVINIITKDAKETQGGLLSVGTATEEPGFGSFRYGGRVNEDHYYRIYSKYFYRDSFADPYGNDAADDWDVWRSGFRTDWNLSDLDSLTFQGGMYSGELGSTYLSPSPFDPYEVAFNEEDDAAGANALLRWTRTYSESSDLSLQLYYDWYEHEYDVMKENRDIFDLDFQHRFAWGDRQEIVWGLGYRYSADDVPGGTDIFFEPRSREDHLFSAFLQDEITLIENRFSLTLGSKFEHNDYTGFEIQPTVRMVWTPHEQHTFWAAISRAMRTPSRGDHGSRIRLGFVPPGSERNLLGALFLSRATGDSDFESEELIAYELGYRAYINEQFSFDVAAFYNEYDNLLSGEPRQITAVPYPPPGYFIVYLHADNQLFGETYGLEISADWRPFQWWQWKIAYTMMQMQLHVPDISFSAWMENREGAFPHHQVSCRSLLNLTENLELDFWLRAVEKLPEFDVPGYVSLDTRIGWQPQENLEVSVGVQNLVGDRHYEFRRPDFINTLYSEIEHNFYVKLTWRF